MPANSLRGRIVTFCSGDSEPRPHAGKLYIPLVADAAELEKSPDEFALGLNIGDDDPIVRWFGEIFKVTTGEDLSLKRADQDRCKANISKFRLQVFAEFKARPKSVLRPQKKLVIRYSLGDGTNPAAAMRETGKIKFQGQAGSVFGLRADDPEREIAWSQFIELVASKELGAFWISTIERMLVSAYNINVDNSEVIATHDQVNLYRLILTTSTTYYNNEMETSIYLVEFYRRRDYGDPVTSLLVKGLHITCRFRFLFLEDQSQFYYLNVKLAKSASIGETARHIISELDILASDTFHAGLHQPAAWSAFVAPEVVEEMAQAWGPLRARLMSCCSDAMGAVDPGEMEAAQAQLADVLTQIRNDIRPHSERLLAVMATQLSEHAKIGSAGPA
jgi:hypothetical protein